MRPIIIAPIALLAVAVAIVGYGTWQRLDKPQQIKSTGTFKYKDKLGTELVFPTRVVAVAGFETTEIQLPGGTWIDCKGDCSLAVRNEHTEIWEAQQQRR